MSEATRAQDGDERPGRIPAWLRWLALALLVLAAALYLRRHGADLAASLELRPFFLLPLVAAEASLLVLRGLLTRVLCARFGVRIGVVEASRLSAWTSFANYVAPLVGGTGLRAVYLKRHHQLPFTSFLSVQMATYTLHFQVASALGLACLPFLPGAAGAGRRGIAVGFAAVLALCLLIHRWPFAAPKGEGRLARTLGRVLAGWAQIRGTDLGPLLAVLGAYALVQTVAIWIGFATLGVVTTAPQALFIAAVYSLSILIAITPAALGISEGAVVFAASAAGLAGPAALAAAAVRRLVAFVVAAAGAGSASLGRRRNETAAEVAVAPAPGSTAGGDLVEALDARAWSGSGQRSGGMVGLLGALIVAVYALSSALVLRLDVNWDEFHYLSYLYDLERGALSYGWATFHVHLFGWLRAVGGGEVNQILAARLALQGLAIGSGVLLYRIASRWMRREAALFAVLAFASFTFVMRSGASFRPDPICAFLLLLALDLLLAPNRGARSAVGAGAALALSTMITIKSGLHLALVAAVALVLFVASPRGRPRLARRFATAFASFAVCFGVLFLLHRSVVVPTPAETVSASPSDAAAKVFGTGMLLPRREVFVRGCAENPLFWMVLVAGVVVALVGLRRSPVAERGRSLVLLSFAAPVASIAFYRNAFPYFYVFILPLAAVVCGAAFEAALDAARGTGGRAWRWLAAVVALTLFSGAFSYAWRHRIDATAPQRQLLAMIHRTFPEPVAYVDRCSMVASFPKVGFFMSSWGIQSYRERRQPIFADLMRSRPVGFLIANTTALRLDAPDELFARMPYSLLPEDVRTLRENFVHHWGLIFVQGKSFRFTAAGGSEPFEILSAGPYTVESDGRVQVDGVERAAGEVVELASGPHMIAAGPGATAATLRFGDHLYRPDFPPDPRPIFLDF